jgi:hypothetical protein
LESVHKQYRIKDIHFFVSPLISQDSHSYLGLGSHLQQYLTSLLTTLHFQFKTYNPSFTQLEISFRFIYSLTSFLVTVS